MDWASFELWLHNMYTLINHDTAERLLSQMCHTLASDTKDETIQPLLTYSVCGRLCVFGYLEKKSDCITVCDTEDVTVCKSNIEIDILYISSIWMWSAWESLMVICSSNLLSPRMRPSCKVRGQKWKSASEPHVIAVFHKLCSLSSDEKFHYIDSHCLISEY